MDNKQIEALLERYWEGETTLTEERLLKQYFAGNSFDERFREVAPLFRALLSEQRVNAPNTLKLPADLPPMRASMGKIWYKLSAAAAVTLLLAAGVWYWMNPNDKGGRQMAGQLPNAELGPKSKPLAAAPTALLSTPDAVPHKPATVAQKTSKKNKRAKNEHLAQAAPPPPPVAPSIEEETYTEAQAQIALEEVKAALALVASKMNKGTRDAAKPLSKVDFEHYIN